MKDYLRRNWWLYLILILACAALLLIQQREAVPVLSPPSFVFTWYAAVIPIVAAVGATVTSAGRGRFDFAPLIAVAVLVFLCMVISVLISGGVFDKPLYVPLIFSVIPAAEALILSGIAYAVVGRRKRNQV